MKYRCNTCKDDPKGVLGLNAYRPCPDCNDVPLNGFEKDRAMYDLVPHLEAVVLCREERREAEERRKNRR